MKEAEFIFAGKIIKPQGFKGEVFVALSSNSYSQFLKKKKFVFIEIKDEKIPFFIEDIGISADKSACVIKFEDIQTTEHTNQILNCKIFIEDKNLKPSKKPVSNDVYSLIGYKVIDTFQGEIGMVDTIFENTLQSILIIKFEEKEILIPIAEEIIQKIDKKNKTLFINAPKGLIELYL